MNNTHTYHDKQHNGHHCENGAEGADCSPARGRERAIFRVTLWCAFWNAALSALKLFAGIFGNSAALVADAVHSVSDFASDLALVFFVRLASRPPDEDHEFGHGKFETLATIIIGVSLLFVGLGLFASGGRDLRAFFREGARPPRPGWITLVAAALSIAVKEAMYHWTLAVGKKHDSAATIANAWDHRADALSSVGALLGVGAAFVFGEKWVFLDPLAAVGVSVVIVHAAIGIISPALGELMEKSLPKKLQDEILTLVAANPFVQSPHNLRTRRLGPGWVAQVHIRVDDEMSVIESHKLTQEIESRVRHKYGQWASIIIHVEPASRAATLAKRHHNHPHHETLHTDGSSDGFTLVEVLIALTLAALLLPSALAVFNSALRASARAEARCETRLAAQSALQTTASAVRADEKQNDLRIFAGGVPTAIVRVSADSSPPRARVEIQLPDGERETHASALFAPPR